MLDHLSQDLPAHCDQLTFLQLADQRHQHHCSATSAATAAEFKKCLDCVIFPASCFYVQLFLVLSRPPSLPILILILDWLVLSGNFWFSSDANVPKLHVSTFASLAQKSDKGGWIDLTEKKGCDVAICIVFAEIHKIHKIHITRRPRLQCACIVTYFWQKLISTNNFRLVQTRILPKQMNFPKSFEGWRGGHSLSKIYVVDFGIFNRAFSAGKWNWYSQAFLLEGIPSKVDVFYTLGKQPLTPALKQNWSQNYSSVFGRGWLLWNNSATEKIIAPKKCSLSYFRASRYFVNRRSNRLDPNFSKSHQLFQIENSISFTISLIYHLPYFQRCRLNSNSFWSHTDPAKISWYCSNLGWASLR